MKITFKSLLFLLSIVSVVSSCSKEDDKNNSIIVGKWRTYQLDEISFVLGCPDKITGNTDGEKWNSFRSKYNGKHSVEGCSYEKDVEFKSDGTCWVDGTKFANYKLNSAKTLLSFTGMTDSGSSYDEEVEVEGVEGTVMMTTTSPLLSNALGPTNSYANNTFFVLK